MVTRRTAHRQYLLKPSKRANQAFLYCVAYAARVARVQVIWVKVMSNHYHIGVYDPNGSVSKFAEELNKQVARHHNAMYGRFESLFSSPGKPSYVRLESFEDLMDKLIYSLANACSAHLVDRASQWPGVITLPGQLGTTLTIERPKGGYFRDTSAMPATIELKLHVPANCPWDADGFRARVARRLGQKEASLREQRQREGRKVLGRSAIRRQRHTDSPSSREPRFKLNPRVAARDKWQRIAALQRLSSFLDAYRAALAAWRAGARDVEFPAGTYKMRVLHKVRCAQAPPAPV